MNFSNFTGSLVKLIPVDKPWYYPYTDTGASIYYNTNPSIIPCKQNYNMYFLVLLLVCLFIIVTYYLSQSHSAGQQNIQSSIQSHYIF